MGDVSPLANVAEALMEGVKSKDRMYHLQKFKKCFVASEAVDFMVKPGSGDDGAIAESREEAVKIGKAMVEQGIISHVTNDAAFDDANLFFRFAAMEESHGHVSPGNSWAELQARPIDEAKDRDVGGELSDHEVSPLDEHNVKLLDNVKPRGWVDPTPKGRYNLVVIGAGAGGLVSSVSVAGLGGKVAIIERHLMGGDCLNVGCVPSKALIRASRAVKEVRNGEEFGISYDNLHVDFGKIMERMRKLRAKIAPVDSAERYSKLGVDVFQGSGKFISKDTVEVNGQKLKFARAVIATGGRARVPDIPGILDVPYLTNATIFNLTELPPVLGVIGGGPIGSELAQAFARFGSKVFLFDLSSKILPREDPEAAAIIQEEMAADGVEFRFKAKFLHLEKIEGDRIAITFTTDGGAEETIELDKLVVSAGRVPNVEGLGLEKAGVRYSPRGLEVNDHLQTTNKNIYGVGDVALPYQFTHVADFSARMVVRNAMFFGRQKFSDLLVPWCTYTSPEVAHVGKYESELKEGEFDTYTLPLEENDRAILEGDTKGFVKIITRKGKDTILGATIVAEHAGDMISEVSVAMVNGVGLGSIAGVIHPYPTEADAIRRCGDLYNKTRLTPTNKAILRNLLRFRR
mmetsp:Transcript_10199/g.18745  ORF Transcript_10199/g.18745 Transcript_10199/m.18745 type:complete len:631 (-) Transcript_10199:112-2004(-)